MQDLDLFFREPLTLSDLNAYGAIHNTKHSTISDVDFMKLTIEQAITAGKILGNVKEMVDLGEVR